MMIMCFLGRIGHKTDWKVVKLIERIYGRTWKVMEERGRSWKKKKTGRIFGLCKLEISRNFQNSLNLSCISSISHIYKGSQVPQLKD